MLSIRACELLNELEDLGVKATIRGLHGSSRSRGPVLDAVYVTNLSVFERPEWEVKFLRLVGHEARVSRDIGLLDR